MKLNSVKKISKFGVWILLAWYHFVMKELKDYEFELNKCSKCGLCQTICPVYKITKNECAVSRGKFIMLHGVTKGDLKLSKQMNKYIDMCLKCGKCRDFCPSDIDVCEILSIAKAQYMKENFLSKIIFLLQSRLIFSNFIKILSFFTHINVFLKHRKTRIPAGDKPVKNVLYFKGCVNQICPNTDKFLGKILKNTSINIIEKDFDCCGLPFLSEGNMERFVEAAKCNIEKINSAGDFEYLMTDCASCESTLANYSKYAGSDFAIDKQKFMNWGELISRENIKFVYKKPVKVTFHRPCHLANDDFFEKIIENCENVDYIRMKDYDSCCGFSGTFGVKNPKLSQTISKQKGENIINSGADYVVTACPSCLVGLKQGLLLNGNFSVKVVSLLEFLAIADEISE